MNLGEFMMIEKAKEQVIKQYDCLCGKKSNIEQMYYHKGRYICRHCDREILSPREYFKAMVMRKMEEIE